MKLPNAYDVIIAALSLLVIINGYFLNSLPLAVISAVAGVAVAVGLEIIVEYIKTKKFIFSKSPVVSGLIIASVVEIGNFPSIALAAVLAIILKKLITKEGMSMFNPAASGMFVAFLLSGGRGEVWWGNTTTLAVLVLGLLVSWRIKRLYISLPYLITYQLGVALLAGVDAALAFFPLFSAFFMLTEPKTTPGTREHQVAFGVLAAVLIHAFSMLNLPSAFLLGILVSNLAGKFFFMRPTIRSQAVKE